MFRFLFHFAIFVFLTILTQIGGLAYLLVLILRPRSLKSRFGKISSSLMIFLASYGVLWVTASVSAPLFGRTPLPCIQSVSSNLVMQSPLYCVLNRHYVTPDMKAMAEQLGQAVEQKYPGSITLALDANFPFWDGFPLLPHLSHDDGNKLDLAYYYQDRAKTYLPGRTRSPIGYWAFEGAHEDAGGPCTDRNDVLTLRWDLPWFEMFNRDYELEPDRTQAALNWLVNEGKSHGVSKIFVEPHLADTLNVEDPIIRFQGCRAARHDDHIHIQIN
ncbi:MAG: hypothetical protein ABJN26_24180 [Stappiaceae bacterium]